MNNNLHITALVDQPTLLTDLVEKLATRRCSLGYANERVPAGLEAVDSSSVEVYMSGTVEIDDVNDQKIRMPFITSSLFTCIKTNSTTIELTWSVSLS